MVLFSSGSSSVYQLTATRLKCDGNLSSLYTFFCDVLQGSVYGSLLCFLYTALFSWLRGTAVERLSLVGERSVSCTRPIANG